MIIRTEIENGYVRLRSNENKKLVCLTDGKTYSEVIVKLEQEKLFVEQVNA